MPLSLVMIPRNQRMWARSGVTEWHKELHIYTEIYVLQTVSQKPEVVAN